MNWLKHLNAALQYIEDNIDQDFNAKDIALHAHSSYTHFSRMFYMLSGVTLTEYIRKRRLTLAANDLVGTDLKVIDIAYKYQYSTPESFSKAFKEFHGVSPRDARNYRGVVKSFSKLSFKLQIGGTNEMNYKMVHKDTLQFSGYSIDVTTKDGQNFKDIPAFWQDVMKDNRFKGLLENCGEMGVLGICYDWNKDVTGFKYMIGINTSDYKKKGMVDIEFGPEDYAAFECAGKLPESVQKTTHHIYNEWFPSSNYEHTAGPELEIYPPGDTTSEDYVCYYWVPIKQKGE